jgi:predicted DNA-binding transcriptional regulator AlpA
LPKARRWAKAAIRANADVATQTVTLASLLEHPEAASSVPPHLIPALVAELASEQVALSAVQGLLTARLLDAQGARAQEDATDRLLTAEEIAATLGVTKRWVQRRARRLPFARRISDHAIRYSESGLKRWLANRRLSVA